MKKIKSEKGYIDGNFLATGCITFFAAIGTILILIFLLSFRLDFASGSHRITPTAIDKDFWGNYKVYYRTSQYTTNAQEDYYYIGKDNKEIAEEIENYIRNGNEIIVYYEKYIGFKGIPAPDTSPIIKVELLEEGK